MSADYRSNYISGVREAYVPVDGLSGLGGLLDGVSSMVNTVFGQVGQASGGSIYDWPKGRVLPRGQITTGPQVADYAAAGYKVAMRKAVGITNASGDVIAHNQWQLAADRYLSAWKWAFISTYTIEQLRGQLFAADAAADAANRANAPAAVAAGKTAPPPADLSSNATPVPLQPTMGGPLAAAGFSGGLGKLALVLGGMFLASKVFGKKGKRGRKVRGRRQPRRGGRRRPARRRRRR